MTRNSSGALTKTMKEQFDILRMAKQKELAETLLELIGVRFYTGEMYVTTKDIFDKEEDLVAYLGQVRAWYTATERQRLYKNNEHLGMSMVKLVLASVGHPLDRSACRIDRETTCSKYRLDPNLY